MLGAASQLNGRLLKDEPLAAYTSWRVGGAADYLYVPSNTNDLADFLIKLPQSLPLLWLGLGSNTLIRDKGVEGVVIVTQGALNGLTQCGELTIYAEAGVSCGQLARYSARLGLKGLEFMAGIPGTVGGALAMNAGCYGSETWQFVKEVEVINRLGDRIKRKASDYQVGYRSVQRPENEWFTAAYFTLQIGKKEISLENIRNLLEKRNMSQPTSWPNGGSVFRNPQGDYAARLIEQSGLKGLTIGKARVSEKHANFIINEGEALAADVETLISEVAEQVHTQQGVRLHPEVCIIGRA